MIRRGEIYWIQFDPTVGAEIKKTRLGLVISNNSSNHYSRLITVLPITSKLKNVYPFEVLLDKGEGGLQTASLARVGQIRTIDKTRIGGKPLGAKLAERRMGEVAQAIKIHLEL